MRASKEKTRPSWFWVLASLIVPFVRLLTKTEYRHAERLPKDGGYVLAVNHYSQIDPLVVAAGVWHLGRAPRFMAKESLFKVPVLGPALRATGMVPVPRTASAAATKASLQHAKDIADHGRGVIVYPEGTLTRDPELWPMRGKTGAVRLALQAGVPLIPAAQWGSQEILPRYGKLRVFPFRKRSVISFGEPIDLSGFDVSGVQTGELNKATTTMMDEIARLLGEIRGEQAPEVRWNPAVHGQNETGRL